MEIVTKLPAPAKNALVPFIAKVVIVCVLVFINIEFKALDEICRYEEYDTKKREFIDLERFLQVLTRFCNHVIPRLVSSGLLFYLGICCGYIGFVQLGWVKPK